MSHKHEINSQTMSLSRRVLNAYHGRVYSLFDYLAHISHIAAHTAFNHLPQIEEEKALHDYLLRHSDPPVYRDLLTKSLVAESAAKRDAGQVKTSLRVSMPSSSMTELIDRAHARLFARTRKPSNVITTGYRSAEHRSETGKGGAGGGRQGVTNFFVNTLVTALQAPEWCLLLKRVGDAIILHLLTETSIYVSLPNDCYCQMTGAPIIYTMPPLSLLNVKALERVADCGKPENVHSRKRRAPDSDEGGLTRPTKRQKKDTEVHARPPDKGIAKLILKDRTAAMIPIARTTIFYARPRRHAKSGRILLGLPPDHILNRMATKAWRVLKGLSEENGDEKIDMRPGDRNGALEARHLSKYVFPLQYHLDNAYSIHPDRLREEQFMRFKFVNRESEIEMKGTCKTPARLKSILPLLGQLHSRHTKCGHKSLLNKICPSKLRPDHKDETADSSTILELISEEVSGEYLQTQMNFTMSDTTSLSIFGQERGSVSSRGGIKSVSRAQAQMKLKPKFAEFTCSLAEVYLYVCTITREVIPYALWGSERNRRAALHHAKQIISGRRHEGTTLHNVMQGISTSECDWLIPSGKHSQKLNQSEAEMLKRRELLQEFILWYFDQFLLPLLRTTFYITDSSAYRNRVLYFRQDDWDVLCRPLLDRLSATTFQRIHQSEAEELLQQRKLGYSFVRLLPKDSGVRPIVNLRRKRRAASDNPFDQGQSINQILAAAFQILRYEQTMQAEKLGASVFGPNETYVRLKEFKKKVADASGKMPKLYFVKVDVQACFDTIEQSKLLGILKDLITEDVYMVQKFGRVIPSAGRVKRTFVRNALPDYEHPHFLTYATQLAQLLRHAILVDQVVYPFAFRDEIVQLLEDHITSNIVKIGKDYYRQRVGIPQGSVLSSLLCSFFYGDLERSVLRFVSDAAQANVLLRLIDDYLFITTDVRDARRFLEVMNQGHPEYGCFIARDKTLTNFEHNVGDISQHSLSTVMHPDRKLFPWCGYLINTHDLSVMADYSRFHATYLTDSLTIERCRRPNAAFMQKMFQASKAKTHAIFTDAAHNSARAVRVNVYQAFVLAAMKMHAYIREARHDAGGLAFMPQAVPSPEPKDSANSGESGPRGAKGKKMGVKGRKNRGIEERKSVRGSGAFLLNAIRQSIRYTYASIRNRASGKIARESGGRCDLSKDEVLWLGTHAFHSVLALKRTAYAHAGVLGSLHAELVHPRFRSVKRRLAGIARESLEGMLRDIRF